MPTLATTTHTLPRGLKKQVQLNTKQFQILMKDIRNDVTRLTQNSNSLDEWITKLGGYTTQNVFITGPASKEATSIVQNIMQSTKYSPLPKGGTQELVKGVMSENTMHYVTKMGEDMKTELRKIAVQSYDAKLAPRDIAKEMATKIEGMSNTRAQVIARTETMRASNLANYAHAVEMGAKSFTVNSDPERCELCGEVYGDGEIVFDISQNDIVPPLHPRCECSPIFSMYPPEEDVTSTPESAESSQALAHHAEIRFTNFSMYYRQLQKLQQEYK